MTLQLVPVSFADACAFVAEFHRHHAPPRGCKYVIGVADGGRLCGVAIVGRPVSRVLAADSTPTLEVVRSATDGTRHANSMLYGAAWRAAQALGYRRLVTYTQEGESGASLRGAGWRTVAELPANAGWDRPSRSRDATGNEGIARLRWEVLA